MELTPQMSASALARLKRAQGQLAGVIKMIEEGRDCEATLTQLAAVSKAIDRAGFTLIASSLKECLAMGDAEGAENSAKLEKLFLSLA